MTTDPDTPARRAAHGAAPGRRQPSPPVCPHCGCTDVELEAEFGSSLMSRQFYCRGCRTVFEWVKWEADHPTDWLEG